PSWCSTRGTARKSSRNLSFSKGENLADGPERGQSRGSESSMKPLRKEHELVHLRRLAEELASGRKERVTSAHLLAAIASRESPASELLAERSLSAERLLRAARASTDDGTAPRG